MKILVADDEELERDALEVLIHRFEKDAEIIKAKNGKEALSYALSEDVDLCILDIRMPLMSGLDAASAIKQEKPDLPFLFLTAWGEFSYAQKAIRLKADDYLVKPVSCQVLKQALDRICSRVDKRKVSSAGNLSEGFFSMLKYGSFLSDAEKLFEDYGIRDFSGSVLTFESRLYNELFADLSKNLEGRPVHICRYDDGIRCTFIIFGINGMLLHDALFHLGYGDVTAGIGLDFSSIAEISMSIASSFKAHSRTASAKSGLLCASHFDIEQAFDKAKVMRLSDELLEYTLSGSIEDVRRALNGISGAFGENPLKMEEAKKELYEIVMVYRHNVQRKIPLFFYPEPDELSVSGLESYLSSLALQAASAVSEDRKDKYKRVFNLISEYLARHYADNPSQEEIAEYVGIRSSYFSRLFKEYYGINFSTYMQGMKMEKAKELLLEGRSIKEASDMVGFSDPNYFTRVFRSHFGVPPKNFKR